MVSYLDGVASVALITLVLILIVVDNGLVLLMIEYIVDIKIVLILIVVDNGLVPAGNPSGDYRSNWS